MCWGPLAAGVCAGEELEACGLGAGSREGAGAWPRECCPGEGPGPSVTCLVALDTGVLSFPKTTPLLLFLQGGQLARHDTRARDVGEMVGSAKQRS